MPIGTKPNTYLHQTWTSDRTGPKPPKSEPDREDRMGGPDRARRTDDQYQGQLIVKNMAQIS